MKENTGIEIVLVILSWIVSGSITYGFMKAKVLEFERRLMQAEKSLEKSVSRVEYENRHSDLLHQLDRIEACLARRS